MSISVWSMISDYLMEPHRKHVLQKLADCGNDDGDSIWPMAHNVYKRCTISASTYRKFLKEFQTHGILIPADADDDGGKGGRGKRRHWKMDLKRIKYLFPHVDTLNEKEYLRLKAKAKKDPYGFWISEANGQTAPEETCHRDGQFSGDETIHGNGETIHRESGKGPPETSKLSTTVDTEPVKSKPPKEQLAPDGDDDPDGSPPSDAKPDPINTAWKAARPHLVAMRSEPEVRTWLDGLIPLSYDDGTLVLGAATPFIARWVNSNLSRTIEAALLKVGDSGKIRIIVSSIASNAMRSKQAKERKEKRA